MSSEGPLNFVIGSGPLIASLARDVLIRQHHVAHGILTITETAGYVGSVLQSRHSLIAYSV